MAVNLFVLGLPGSGKSTIARSIHQLGKAKQCTVVHTNDYAILRKMYEADTAHRQFTPTREFDGFDIRDLSVFNTALQKLEKMVRGRVASPEKRNEIILIEFARSDYQEAFRQFSPSFLQDSYYLYLATNIATCKQRVRSRAANPRTKDDYFVSDYIFDAYYSSENGLAIPDILKAEYGIDGQRVHLVKNNGTLKNSSEKMLPFIDRLFVEACVHSKVTESVNITEDMESLVVAL